MQIEQFIAEAAEQAKRMLKPYPYLEEDLEKAKENFSLTPFDLAVLAKKQNEWCIKCGECCRHCTPINISRGEAELLAQVQGLPYKKFKQKFKLTPRGDGTFNMPAAPCPFLEGNLCSVYAFRPLVCRVFPAGEAIVDTVEGKQKIEFPFYCHVVKKLFAYKIFSLVISFCIERELPFLAEQFKNNMKKLAANLKTRSETMQFALAWAEAHL
jgi:Fe-S-cluster containining protein